MQLKESATEGTRQHFAAPILPCMHIKSCQGDSIDVDNGDGTCEGVSQQQNMNLHACKDTVAATI